jgi:hypothetical protein
MRYFGARIGAGYRSAVRSLFVWAWAIEIAAGSRVVQSSWPQASRAPTRRTHGSSQASQRRWAPCTPCQAHSSWARSAGGRQRSSVSQRGVRHGSGEHGPAAGGGITGLFAVEAVVSIANLIWTSWLARRALAEIAPGPLTGGRVLHRAVWQYAAVSTIGAVLVFVVWRRSELSFLERFSTETEIGLYSIASPPYRPSCGSLR